MCEQKTSQPNFARRVRGWAMSDSMAALILGVGMLARGVLIFGRKMAEIPPPPHPAYHPVETMLPMTAWAIIWITAGVGCIAVAFARSPYLEALFLSIGVGLHMLWGFSFVTASFTGEYSRGATSSISFFMVAALILWAVWRGKRGDLPTEREKGGH